MRTLEHIKINSSIPGWMSEDELIELDNLSSSITPGGIIVEVGSLFGRSSYCLARANSSATVYCFDNFANDEPDIDTFTEFCRYTRECNNIYASTVNSAAEIIWDPALLVDMVFLDESHCNPIFQQYIDFWLPKIRSGGFLCGHDFNPNFPDVIENVSLLEQLLGKPVTIQDSLWIFTVN